jgi:hypothetical protein
LSSFSVIKRVGTQDIEQHPPHDKVKQASGWQNMLRLPSPTYSNAPLSRKRC